MSYGIVRVQKMTSGSVKGIEIHDRREKEKSHTNPDIDFSRSGENYDLCPAQNENFQRAVKDRIDSLNLKKAVRKDAVVMAQVLVTSDGTFFDGLSGPSWEAATHSVYASDVPFTQSEIRAAMSQDRTREFFQKAYDFLEERYGAENVISATVHLDEATPHMHFNFVPVTPDGRLCAKDVLSRAALIDQQTAFHEQVGQAYGLERGEPKEGGKRRKHLETAEYKAVQAAEQEARAELQNTRQELQEARQELQEARQELQEARQELQEARQGLEAVKGEMEGLRADRDALRSENDVLQQAIERTYERATRHVSRESLDTQIATLRTEKAKETRLALLEKFVALPQIAPIWEKFQQMIQRERSSKKKRHEQEQGK